MRKVMIGTPSYDGKVDVFFADSLINTVRLAMIKEIELHPVYIAYDALVQRARNDLVQMAIDGEFDDLIFIDSDIQFDPNWIFTLLDHDADVVGGTYPKKSDMASFPVKALPEGVTVQENGLAEVEGLGTGFLRISSKAFKAVSEISTSYTNDGKSAKMVFDVQIVDGDLVSEDNIFCRKWRELGGKIYLDTSMTCAHIGTKRYIGSFQEYLNFLNEQEKATDGLTNDN